MPTTISGIPRSQISANNTLYTSDAALGAGTVTSSAILIGDAYVAADLVVKATISGTTTLNVYIQKQLADGSWSDVVSFTQITATGGRTATVYPVNATADAAIQDAALTAGSIRATLIGKMIRVKGVVAGASPNCQFTVYGDFFKLWS
jgi:hypothetical protein